MTGGVPGVTHPNLERYYDRATDRAAFDVHIAGCVECQAWLADIHERLRHLACSEFVELVTECLEDAVDEPLRGKIDDHLRLCEGCRNYLDEIRATVATIGRSGGSSKPPDLVSAGTIAAFRIWRSRSTDRRD
jgi:predicted anti-sigma-YlaC factor YlaD